MNTYRRGAARRAVLLAVVSAVALVATAGSPAVADAACANAKARADQLRNKEIRAALRCIINKQRSPNLQPKDQLREAAQDHTGYMRDASCVSHQCSGEPSLYERIRRTGYFNGASRYSYGEVIATNRDEASPREIVRQWMNSSGHRAQLMSKGFEHLGVGVNVGRRSGLYTIVLGSRSG